MYVLHGSDENSPTRPYSNVIELEREENIVRLILRT